MGRAHYTLLAQHRHHRLLRRGRGRGRAAGTGRARASRMRWPPWRRSRPPCSRPFAAIRCPSPCTPGAPPRPASPPRWPRRAGVTGSLDVHGGRGGLRPRDGRRARTGTAALATLGQVFHIAAMTVQEPRLLRPHLRRDRRRAGAAARRWASRRRTSSAIAGRHLRRGARRRRQRGAAHRRRGPLLAALRRGHRAPARQRATGGVCDPKRLADPLTRELMARIDLTRRPRARRRLSRPARGARVDPHRATAVSRGCCSPRARATPTRRSATPNWTTSSWNWPHRSAAARRRAPCSIGCGGSTPCAGSIRSARVAPELTCAPWPNST